MKIHCYLQPVIEETNPMSSDLEPEAPPDVVATDADGEEGEAVKDEQAAELSETEDDTKENKDEDAEVSGDKKKPASTGNQFVFPSRLNNLKKTTFGHQRREVKAVDQKSLKRLINDDLSKDVGNVENDLVFYRQFFFPEVVSQVHSALLLLSRRSCV